MTTPMNDIVDDILKDFDEKFVEDNLDWWLTYYERDNKTRRNEFDSSPSKVKSFLRTALLDIIERTRACVPKGDTTQDDGAYGVGFGDGFNQCIDEFHKNLSALSHQGK